MAGFGGFGSANNNHPFGGQPPAGPFGSTAAPAPSFGAPANNPFNTPAAPASTGFSPFGSPAPNTAAPPTPFGTTANMMNSNSTPPASAFGSPPPFGNSSAALQTNATSNPFGGNSTGFGNSNPSSGFGNSTPPNPFGGSSAQPPTTFAAPSSSSSWQPPTTTPFGNTAAAAPSTNPFGGGAPSAAPLTANNHPFGAPAPAGPPAMTPFGVPAFSTAAPSATSPFGATNSTNHPFGGTNNQSSAPSNPFATAGSAAPAAPMVFASAQMDSNMNSGGTGPFGKPSNAGQQPGPFGQSTASATASSSPFGQTASSGGANPFGSPNPTQKKDKKFKPPRSDLPFGTPAQSQSGGGGNGDGNAAAGATWPPPPTLSKSRGIGRGGGSSPTNDDGADNERKKKEALLEKKKKRLEMLKKKKEAEAAARADSPRSPTAAAATLNASAAPFVPSAPEATASLAERNAARFDSSAANSATRAHLPTDLQAKAGQAVDYSALRSSGADRENLHQAKSLVGTCAYMCPDEELLRREREGDIQLLELVQPGSLHPQGWTLRDTAIKRFRRSAADYKLDVPEWVRPPDVLENVCGYLEEWVMERDRQGPDPRVRGGAPQPLDVYQFIWDRTRMIRKDFTLQNYVGTGGNCDARAVRCHERIARWHTMCEHQLSHIQDFVVMQSQQNVQELGQTMKTLNQFYDDALKRSRVEVPDESGNETRTDLTGFTHGCSNETVQGSNPSDYDGTELKNPPESASRLVGKQCVQQFHHGTAEPEMRGLYILLTIDNDGGMEVMRYAAHLSRERPEIFQSVPVQLALKIYKAKKESNYSRFFRFLRSPSTPYLFACIMFKYVPQMRRLAFEVMSKTFGGKNRETNDTLYDQYPLRDLVRNLCFEDEEEALAACRHYSITVKPMKVKSSSGTVSTMEIVFWRMTDFREPKDPEKEFPIPLRPKKMVTTIERKRSGATRLSVCRGDVSGEGAFLLGDATPSTAQGLSFDELARRQAQTLAAMKDEETQRERSQQRENEKRAKEAEMRQKLAEKQAKEESERVKKEQERERREKLEQEKRLAKEREIAQKKAEEEARVRKLEAERLLLEQKKAEEERQRRLEEERIRREKEEAERERLRQIEEKRKEEERRKAEEERRRMEAEQERLRKEEEARERELARIREAERKKKEAEERRVAKEWNEKSNRARKLLALKRWKRKLPRQVEIAEATKNSLLHLKDVSISPSFLRTGSSSPEASGNETAPPYVSTDLRSVVDSALRSSHFQVSFDRLRLMGYTQDRNSSSDHSVYLVKIGVLFPESVQDSYAKLCSLVHILADSCLDFGLSKIVPFPGGESRVTFVDANIPDNRDVCDGVLIVVPSGNSGIPSDVFEDIANAESDIPRTALLLTETVDNDLECSQIHHALTQDSEEVPIVRNTILSPDAINNALLMSVESILDEIVQTKLKVIERIPVDHLGMLCLNEVLWLENILDSRDGLLQAAKNALAVLVDELDKFGKTGKDGWNWPSKEFVSSHAVVQDYFGKGVHLPSEWPTSLLRENVELPLQEFSFRLNGSFPHVISKLLAEAPDDVVEHCRDMYEQRMFRRCLQRALLWRGENEEPWQTIHYVFLPRALVDRVIKRTVEAVSGLQDQLHESRPQVQFDTSIAQQQVDSPAAPLPLPPLQESLIENVDDDPPEPVMDPPLSSRKRGTPKAKVESSENRPSKRLRDSQDFTRRLEAMASGNFVPSALVGGRPLSTLLQGAPPPLDPSAWRSKRNRQVEDIFK